MLGHRLLQEIIRQLGKCKVARANLRFEPLWRVQNWISQSVRKRVSFTTDWVISILAAAMGADPAQNLRVLEEQPRKLLRRCVGGGLASWDEAAQVCSGVVDIESEEQEPRPCTGAGAETLLGCTGKRGQRSKNRNWTRDTAQVLQRAKRWTYN
jgi:hypothetical protein